MASPSDKPAPAQMPSKPLTLLPDATAQLYANLHPILLLSILVVTFPSLVADPVPALLGLAPTTATLQLLYCVLCLPLPASPVPKPGQKKKPPRGGQDVWARVVPAMLSLTLTLTLAAPTLALAVVAFGAPLTTHQPHTLLVGAHLALLATPQLFYARGLEAAAWLEMAGLQMAVDEGYGMALGACLGAWTGAMPIPLDWDREWQRWPVTIVAGMYAGAVVGKVLGGHAFHGCRMTLS